MIDDVDIDVDVDGNNNPVMYLVLSGDFDAECWRCLTDMSTTRLMFRIDRNIAEKLHKLTGDLLTP